MGRGFIVLGVLVHVLFGAATGTASAEPPLEVSDRITDSAGVLGEGEVAARDAVDALAAETGIDLYAVLVSDLAGRDDGDWVRETARLSGLDGTDVLFAVAAGEDTYEYAWWVDEDFPLSEVDVEAAFGREVEPALAASDWSAAVVALAEELRAQAPPVDEERPSWSATTTVLVAGAVAAVLLGAHLLSRRRSPVRSRHSQ